MALAKFLGSLSSSGLGFPCATSQKGHLLVHISPMIIKVAVPREKHSGKLGQLASSQTDAKDLFLRIPFVLSISGFDRTLTLNQCGFGGKISVGITFTGIRLTFSAPLNFSPTINLFLFAKMSPMRSGLFS